MAISFVPRSAQRGFTLIELVMVIILMGIIGGMVAVFMKSPIDAYFDSARRAGLTDVADTVVRRMARDIQRALPNSLGTSSDGQCLEFIPTKTGGRYREQEIVNGDNTSLNFAVADDRFNMLGDNNGATVPADQKIGNGDVVVIYNLGIPGADAYQGDNTAVVSGVPTVSGSPPETSIVLAPVKQFPLQSSAKRFQVVPASEQVVAYVCSAGRLYRLARSVLGTASPGSPAHICPASGSATVAAADPIIAANVNCGLSRFNYSGSDLQRNALVSMTLALTDKGETITLQHEVHVSNVP